jgi:tetratricopeptide (TPR) repeat protein
MLNKFLNVAFLLFTFSFVVLAQPSEKQIRNATRLAKEAEVAIQSEKYRLAIEKFSDAVKAVPNFPAAYLRKAYCYYKLQDYPQSIQNLNISLSQGALPIEIYKLRWLVYYNTKDYKLSMVDVVEALKLEPENPYFNLAYGDVNYALGNFREAATGYSKAAILDPKNPDTYYYVALSYNKLKDYPKEADAAEKAIQAGTKYKLDSYTFLGRSLLNQRKYPEAAVVYEKILDLKQGDLDTYQSLGEIYRNLNRYQDAIAAIRQGLRLYPKNGNFYISLSWYYSLAKFHQEAVNSANEAIKLLPKQSMGWTNLCRAYNDLKKYNEAIQACNSALILSPDNGETYLYLGRAYDSIDKPDIAVNMYPKAVAGLLAVTRENPDDSDGFYLLGNAYLAVSQLQKAVLAYTRSLELSSNFPSARYNLGYTYTQLGEKILAKKQLDFLVKIKSDLATKLTDDIKKMKKS